MKKFAKVFLRIIWVLIGIFCILLILATIEQGKKYIFIGVIFLNAFWWISSVYVYKLSRFNKRRSYWNFKQEAVYENYASSKESSFWYKTPKGIKIAAVSIWLLIGIMFLFFILSECGGPQPSISSTEIFLSAGWLIITIVVFAFIGNAEKKTDKRLLELYDEKFLSELELCDEFLGTMRFKYDSHLGTLERLSLNLPPFGAKAPSWLNISNYIEEDKDKIIELLKEVYAHADEILNGASEYACKATKEYYDEELDSKKIREYAKVTDIDVKNGEKITLHIYSDNGEENDFSSFTVMAWIDLREKTIDYDLID